MNRKAAALILTCILIVVLVVLGAATLSRSITENRLAQNNLEIIQAFWLAEAGLNQALDSLRGNFNIAAGTGVWSGSLSLVEGEYSVDLGAISGQERTVTAHGFIPSQAQSRHQRTIEATARQQIPPNFYDHAVYSAGDVDFNGNSYSVSNNESPPDNKAVIYSGEYDVQQPGNINGTSTQDSSISPLARLDFPQLLSLSQGQGNVYDESRLDDVKNGDDSFPGSFWYAAPSDPSDPTTGTPNIVYVTEELNLNGNIGTIGGFFVVAGDVITDPDEQDDTVINGTGQIDGVVYTRGTFRINGGGGNLNIDGGVWAGEEARLNGNAHVTYNKDYMSAIQSLGINADAQFISWRDTQNIYSLD